MTAELLSDAGDGGAKDELEVASSVNVAVTWIPNHSFRFVPPNALASSSNLSFALQSGRAGIGLTVAFQPKHQLGQSALSPLGLHTATDLCARFFAGNHQSSAQIPPRELAG